MALNNTTALQQAGKLQRGNLKAGADLLRDIIATIQGLSDTEVGFIDGVVAGTVSASKALVVDANKDIASVRHLTLTGNIRHSVATVAAAGSLKTDAAALTADLNIVTAADNAKGVALPAAVAGDEITVVNTVTNKTLLVYPKDSDDASINGGTTDAAVEVGPGKSAKFVCLDGTHWYSPDAATNKFAIKGSTVTATGTGGTSTATLSESAGVVTTDAITTAAAANHVMTITNTKVAVGDIILLSQQGGTTSTGTPLFSAVAGAGTIVVTIMNKHASAAFNAALVFAFLVVKQT